MSAAYRIEADDAPEPLPRAMLSEDFLSSFRRQDWQTLVKMIAYKHGTTFEAIIGHNRNWWICDARHEVMARLVLDVGFSMGETARRLGNRDHTTVLSGIRRFLEGSRKSTNGDGPKIIRPRRTATRQFKELVSRRVREVQAERKASGVVLSNGHVPVPKWARDAGLAVDYADFARIHGEEYAASVCRRLKREAEHP